MKTFENIYRHDLNKKNEYMLYGGGGEGEVDGGEVRDGEVRDDDGFHIAGLDEVGRGSLAGPVVASAVILDMGVKIEGLDDSKNMSYKKRLKIYEQLLSGGMLSFGVGIIEAAKIDKINIHKATKEAMYKALNELCLKPNLLLIDALKLEKVVDIAQESIIKGDSKSACIAAASIVSKVIRDKLMEGYSKEYEAYGFERNKGYPTKEHKAALNKYGAVSIHRKSYKPVHEVLNKSLPFISL